MCNDRGRGACKRRDAGRGLDRHVVCELGASLVVKSDAPRSNVVIVLCDGKARRRLAALDGSALSGFVRISDEPDRTRTRPACCFARLALARGVLVGSRMYDPQEVRRELQDVIEAFGIQLRAQRDVWTARNDRACLSALSKLLERGKGLAASEDVLFDAIELVREELIALARELDTAFRRHGQPVSRADVAARRALLDLMTVLTDVEEDVGEDMLASAP